MSSAKADLVVLAVADLESAVKLLDRIGLTVVEPTYESGTVWRIPCRLTTEAIRDRLRHLPAVFPDVPVYFTFEYLEEVRASSHLQLELLARPTRRESDGRP